MLDPLLIADLLVGIKGTLDEVVGRVESKELNAQLEGLRDQAAAESYLY